MANGLEGKTSPKPAIHETGKIMTSGGKATDHGPPPRLARQSYVLALSKSVSRVLEKTNGELALSLRWSLLVLMKMLLPCFVCINHLRRYGAFAVIRIENLILSHHFVYLLAFQRPHQHLLFFTFFFIKGIENKKSS